MTFKPLPALALALVACTAAIALLLLGWAQFGAVAHPVGGQSGELLELDTTTLRAVRGKGQPSGDLWQLTELNPQGQALATMPVSGAATSEYAHVRYRVSNFPANNDLVFFWVTEENPERPGFLDLHPPAVEQDMTFRMTGRRGWEGTVTEVGLAVFPLSQVAAPSRLAEPIEIQELSLIPATRWASVTAMVTEWAAFRPWSFRSINSLRDSPRLRIEPSPVGFVAACVVVCTLILAWFPGLRLGLLRSAMVCVALGWVALDLRWQRNLMLQNNQTQSTFSGLSASERSAKMGDYDLVALIQKVRPQIEPEPAAARIFVATQTPYLALRAAYHLAPLRAAPFMPGENRGGAAIIAPGDYVLIHKMPGALFNPATGVLEFERVKLAAERVFSDRSGALFRVVGAAIPKAT